MTHNKRRLRLIDLFSFSSNNNLSTEGQELVVNCVLVEAHKGCDRILLRTIDIISTGVLKVSSIKI